MTCTMLFKKKYGPYPPLVRRTHVPCGMSKKQAVMFNISVIALLTLCVAAVIS